MDERMYSRRQVAEILGKHYSTIRRWEGNGRIKVAMHVMEGAHRAPRFAESEIERIRAELTESDLQEAELETVRREMEALRRESELLRGDLTSERELVRELVDQLRVMVERNSSMIDRLLLREPPNERG